MTRLQRVAWRNCYRADLLVAQNCFRQHLGKQHITGLFNAEQVAEDVGDCDAESCVEIGFHEIKPHHRSGQGRVASGIRAL